MKMSVLFQLAVLASVLLLGFFGFGPPAAEIPAMGGPQTWYLVTMNGEDYSRHSPRITLTFDCERLHFTGYSGCRAFQAEGRMGEDKMFSASRITTKAAACGDSLEAKYFAALRQATHWKIANGELLLRKDERNILVFSNRPHASPSKRKE
jgi:heat shock protein HslJ